MQYENNPANAFRDIVRKLNLSSAIIKSMITLKLKVINKVKSHNPQKAHIHPIGHVCVQYEKIQQMLSEILSGNCIYHRPSIRVNNRLKIKGKSRSKVLNPQKAHLHPLRDVCMQYENSPANAFRDIVRKRNTAARPYMVMKLSPAPTSWARDKNCQITPNGLFT